MGGHVSFEQVVLSKDYGPQAFFSNLGLRESYSCNPAVDAPFLPVIFPIPFYKNIRAYTVVFSDFIRRFNPVDIIVFHVLVTERLSSL